MAIETLISWEAPEHLHFEKRPDWYWIVGIVTLALTAVAIIFGNIITGIFILVASTALVLHSAKPARNIVHEINDRGIVIDGMLYPFLSLESFWIPHDEFPPKLLVKSRKTFMPLLVIYIDEVDPDSVREILLRYIAETEHRESIFKHLLEIMGF
jgi:hypothetical protein